MADDLHRNRLYANLHHVRQADLGGEQQDQWCSVVTYRHQPSCRHHFDTSCAIVPCEDGEDELLTGVWNRVQSMVN